MVEEMVRWECVCVCVCVRERGWEGELRERYCFTGIISGAREKEGGGEKGERKRKKAW